MDTGLTVRPTLPGAQATLERPPAPVREAIATNLPPAQSVTASNGIVALRQDPTPRLPVDSAEIRKIVLDDHSREVIFQVVDFGSGRVVRQAPEEAILRLRAYMNALSHRTQPEQSQADLEA